MSIQTILASGFLLLGGIFLPYWAAALGWLSYFIPLLSLLFVLLGVIPLLLCLWRDFWSWYRRTHTFTQDQDPK